MILRPYQSEGITDIYEAWKTDPVLMFVLATGGGKTVAFVEVIRRELQQGNRVLVIAHREELITQAWNTLYGFGIYAGIIMAGYPESYSLSVQVCSIQTLARRKNLPPADVVIIDEGHHAQKDNTYGKIIKNYYKSRILLVTATPYRLSGEGFRFLHPSEVTRLIVNRTLKQLTTEGWLVPLKYYAASIPDLKDVHLNKGDYQEDEARKAMEWAPLVESYMEHAVGKQGVVFTINIAHSLQTVSQYIYQGIPAEHLDGSTPDAERKRILSDFRAGLVRVISNVGIITEGFDFPDLQFCQLARPTKSLNLYLQMVGRTTRALPGLVDQYETAEERLTAIARSSKPAGIILDNAGCWQDHGLPDIEHNWQYYFEGANKKKQKEQEAELMEMLVFVAEDKNGVRRRTSRIEEIEGMRLIEVTREKRQKVINFNVVKEFDKHYAIFKNQKHVKKPGELALRKFMEDCKKKNILITYDIWEHMYRKLVSDTQDTIQQLYSNRSKFPNSYPEHTFQKAIEDIEVQGMASGYFKRLRSSYEAENQKEIISARFAS